MKNIFYLIIFIFVASNVLAHSGRTDSSGGHNNRKTGGYHYHGQPKYSPPPAQTTKPKSQSAGSKKSSDSIKEAMIKDSISAYPGNCPCPYNRASNGSRCGKRSAWSKPGGYAPLCYSSDITDGMVRQYKRDN